ncbi:cell division protein FtsK [Aurantiacibacter atlanticus]|uniref:DNA translocase FtsK n=1 Tax=Aurantiacibacter atlanticus TaxID=1648404 RepID=A0A0H4VV73_9SPHN|nr:DNA translocase FtsK 4TM domain-containing protein [Aurantiacibacter atlanticus]AKQ40943.1 cell division protein FtsK [Aurantiacibacter atlanticus]MDF1834268.1 DNA translocase FtsK 4TM domain-containing protein [Alteraurantiacibacter sp. bin_em_oilr2.035]
MATRASHQGADMRAAFRRSLARSAQLTGAVLLYGFTIFLALSLLSYSQTDPSLSTAAGDVVDNWMGKPGAFAADLALISFGWASVLLLPLTYVSARKLWRDADFEEYWDGKWWGAVAMLLLGMALLATTLALVTEPRNHGWPAGFGGLVGLLGEAGIRAIADLLPEAARFWTILAAGVASLLGGATLAGRVFAVDWSRFLTIPNWIKNRSQFTNSANPFKAEATRKQRRRPEKDAAVDSDGDDDTDDDAEPAAPRRAPEISDPASPPRRARPATKASQKDLFAEYDLPGIDLLEEGPANQVPALDKLALERNARLLETVLDDFNVKGEITAVKTGPVVTMYELEPAPGIKASRVIGLAEDIARNMSAISARVAPIPGKTVMGIELPNANRQMVNFREMVGSEAFAGSNGGLPIILGKGISGEPVVTDLAAMPHLLVAGTTGSGKSVGLNCILLSLLYRFTPAECRLILIDPKVLELKSYDDIPHLLAPVVTEPHKSVRSLKWAVEEMERRYRMMSEIGARNLVGFNERVAAAAAKGKPLKRTVQTGYDPETGEAVVEEKELDYEVLPQIVLIVDELADLMVTVGKEIEVLIQRLSQKSRAAGIHLIMATQRPSVDVITGVIKANLPTRISFNVTSRIDSRTILGEQGAEQLLGKGDMLYKPNTGALKRVHGPFVSDEEVEKVADHWRGQGAPAYVDSVTEEPEDGGFNFEDEFTASDNPEERKYRQACQIVIENQKASGSWLQRQMGVGYNTAAKWIERMEGEGLVGPANHVGRREIFRDRDGNPL